MNFKIGCSGFQEARSKYYNEFSTVEIQQTFFQPPPVGTVRKWRTLSPGNFEFTIKAWQLITHEPTNHSYRNLREKLSSRALASCGFFKPTRMVFEAWQKTETIAETLNAKIIVFQSSKNFKPTPLNIRNFKTFFRRINRKKFNLVWEPNNKWPANLTQQLCDELGLIYSDNPFSEKPVSYGPISYFRLRGKNGYRSRYNERDFKVLNNFEANGKPVYFIFNNASMLFDARNFLNYFQRNQKKNVVTLDQQIENPTNESPKIDTSAESGEKEKTAESPVIATSETEAQAKEKPNTKTCVNQPEGTLDGIAPSKPGK